MSILKIARMGHPVLQMNAEPVEDPTAPEIRRLVADMVETMADVGGTGLAAPQVHVPLRVVTFFVSGHRTGEDEDDTAVPLTVLINPEIEVIGDEYEEAWEACLSLPGLTGAVERPHRIRYRGVTLSGEVIEREAAGFHARVVQHECDHLDGVLYPMRMEDLSKFAFVEEIVKAREMAEAEEQADNEADDEAAEAE
ncbi:MAG: peptide deformylase [Rhodospirillales bacterium]|jgi:peptide deformylase|nr:peptide deformylase [Rhodospirillales bacterium]